jgi:hypothetical protein
VLVLARELHLDVDQIDRMTAAELRWWSDSLRELQRESRRLQESELRSRTGR